MFCIIIPCFNESKRFPVKKFENFLSKNPDVLLCFSNDGSTDNTLEIISELRNNYDKQVLVYNLEKNSGKAEAVRQALIHCLMNNQKIETIGFCDADLATPLSEMLRLDAILKSSEKLKCVFGSRWSRLGGEISRKSYRHYLGRIIATYISISLGLNIYDSQCGAKVFKRDLAENVFNFKFDSKWLFDVEIFARSIVLYGHKKISLYFREEALLDWHEVEGSKVTFADGIRAFYEIYKTKKKYLK